jgi:hypothetical protein
MQRSKILSSLIYFNSPITKHSSPFQKTPHIFPVPLLNQEVSAALEALGGGLQNFL